MQDEIATYLEIGTHRTFAGAIEWPGWCRSGRTEDEALRALAACGPRYGEIAARAGVPFEAHGTATTFRVVARLDGGSGTDFGAPTVAPPDDRRPLDAAEIDRHSRLLVASWAAFDASAAAAVGVELRKGPRGGGRDLTKIVDHVVGAEEAYLVQLGARPPRPGGLDPAAIGRLRAAVLEAVGARALGRPLANPSKARSPWTPRYHVRRAAWHVLDHAWEIEDRAAPGPSLN